MTVALDATAARRRYVVLRALRWLPVGLLIPVFVLLLLDRGLSLGQIGLVTATQGVVIMLLELPTGGLADAIGRRPTLAAASAVGIAAMGLLVVARSIPLLVVVFALQGIHRALDSGPLEAWYVDTAQRADPEADIEAGLAAGGVALGVAIAGGALASSGLVALDPVPGIDALVVPLLAALALQVVDLAMVVWLVVEPDRPSQRPRVTDTIADVPSVVVAAVRTVRGSRPLLALVTIELLWGFGMVAFEGFTPARLAAVTASRETAAALMGPANAGAWLLSAAGAAVVPRLSRRVGPPAAGVSLLAVQAVGTAGIGILAGPVGVITAFAVVMTVHGAANVVHQGILHRSVAGPEGRATVASANSLMASAGGAVGGIALGTLADATTLTTAVLAGAATLALAAPLYLRTRERPRRSVPVPACEATR